MLSLPWGAGFHAGALRLSGGRRCSLPACWGNVLIGDAKGELAPNIHIQALRWGFMGAIEGLPRDQHLARTLKRFPATFSEADSSYPLSSLPVGPSESCFLGLANPGDGSPQFRRLP